MSVLEKFGIVCICIVALQLCRFLFKVLYENFFGPTLGVNRVDVKKYGKWAVVTGATDGIGKAYSQYLAKRGLNIVLISRTQAKLEEVAKEIGTKYSVETKTVAVDFTKPNIYHEIDKQLTGMEIGVLINNVGMSYDHPENFLAVKNGEELFANLIHCNITSVTNMCKMVMPGMVERGRGIVVNIASTAAQIPSPLLTVYAASKAYVVKFSEDLLSEYKNSGIVIQCLLPGYVATNMSKIRSSTWMAPAPIKYVTEAMKRVGPVDSSTGYFPHSILVGVVHTVQSISPQFARWVIIRTMSNIRARALRRTMN